MAYHIDATKITLKALRKRIEATDLIPSRTPLLQGIADHFNRLQKHGLSSLADLRKALKSAKSILAVSEATGIASDYLTLLRREIEGYFPKSRDIEDFDWLPQKEAICLRSNGFTDAAVMYEELDSVKKRSVVSRRLGIDVKFIDNIHSLASLTRIQWTSPTTARMLIAAGYDTPEKVAQADGPELCEALDRTNKANGFFKGKIGLRDVHRLIKAASYV